MSQTDYNKKFFNQEMILAKKIVKQIGENIWWICYKAHFDPGTFYYILSNNPQKNVQYAAQVAPTLGQAPKNTRPVWNYPGNVFL